MVIRAEGTCLSESKYQTPFGKQSTPLLMTFADVQLPEAQHPGVLWQSNQDFLLFQGVPPPLFLGCTEF